MGRLTVVACFFLTGVWMIVSQTKKFATERDPAAIRQSYDFTHLRGSALEIAMRERTLGGIQIVKKSDGVGLQLGHFALVNSFGEKTLGCREYPKVVMQFEAEGTVVNGERPQMEVEGDCEYSEDLTSTHPMWIPFAKILNEKPADGEFQFREGKAITIRFANLGDEWPRKWILVGVKMSGRSEFTISRQEVLQTLGPTAVVDFNTVLK